MSESGRSSKPVVFLAFADSVEANLPRLADELRQVRAALAPAVNSGWCQVIERANVTLDDILTVFREQRDQIVLFHYAGHATSYQLLFSASAGRLSEVNAGGLAEFLSQQRNLHLVFLNGCSTGGQVDALLDAGVGAVIATAQEIRDDAATEIAQAFYQSFAAGQPLQTAYSEAVATMRARYGEDVASSTPWQLRIRPEQNHLRDWKLASPLTLLSAVDCPYRGLEFFSVEHAANYFGRQAMTAKLLAKVQECNFIAVVGPSGSGKSSLVRAGLMVALQNDAIGGSRDWRMEIFRPGENPLQSLAGALLKLNPSLSEVDRWTEIEKLAKRLGNGELSIGLVLDQLRGSLPKLVLIVDQFEETFTLCTDEKLRASFLDTLLTATDPKSGKPWLTVIFTLRADFYGRVLEQERFSQRVDAGLVNVLPMTPDERRAAIEQPALQAQRSFESGLVERILDAVEAEPGQLPLLEFALTELWQRQTPQGVLTHAAYETIGEVSGAIAKRADETLHRLPAADQQRVRTIFTRLVRVAPPDEGSEDTKRRLLLDEIDPTLRPLVQVLADARLVVTGRDEQQQSDIVEVAHEALIRNWNVLQSWLNSDREFLLWRQRLRILVENWQTTGKDEGGLLRSVTLNEAQGWLAARASELSQIEQTFITESQHAAARQQAEREAARQRQLEQERALTESQRLRAEEQQKRAEDQATAAQNLRRRNQWLQAALVLAFIAFGVAALFWGRANDNAAEAEKAKRRAQADEMAARVEAEIAQNAIVDDSVVLLARDAVLTTLSVDNYVTINADKALRDVVDIVTWRTILPTTDQRHQGAVYQANYSPDGTWIVSAGIDKTVRIWESSSLHLVKILNGHTSGVNSAVFSPDGKTVVSASDDNTIKLWDVATGKEIHSLTGHTAAVNSVAFSPDGKTIVSASDDYTVRLWDVATEKIIHTLIGYSNRVASAAFSPDGKMIVVSSGNSFSNENTLNVWGVATGKVIRTFTGNSTRINSAVFSPDGKIIVSANNDHTIKLWEVATSKLIRTLIVYNEPVNFAVFSPDGKTIISASGDFSSNNNTLRLWEVATRKERSSLTGHTADVNTAVFSPDGKTVVSASDDHTVRLWDVATGKEIRSLIGHTAGVNSAAFSPDGKTVVSASDDYTVRLWDVATGKEIHSLIGHTASVNSATFSPDGKTIVSASDDYTVRLWDIAAEKIIHTLIRHSNRVASADFSPDSKMLVTVIEGGTITLWDVASNKEIRTFTMDVQIVGAQTAGANSAVFSPDGKIIVSANGDNDSNTQDNTIKLWDVATGQMIRSLTGHTAKVNSAAFSSDGKTIVSASDDHTIRLWDVTSGKEIRAITEHTANVNSASFSPDGKTFITSNSDQTMWLWVSSIGDLLLMAEERTHRPLRKLTGEERRLYGLD